MSDIIEKLGMTPGPWEWKINEYFDSMVDINGDEIINDGSAHGEYGQCIKGDSLNAQLIATAPELLKALIERCMHLYYTSSSFSIYSSKMSEMKKLINIIEKACYPKKWEEIKVLYETH